MPHRPTLRTVTRMARPEILPFDENHLSDAGRLLAERHRRHRLVQPLLPKRFEDPDVARAGLGALACRRTDKPAYRPHQR